MDYRRTLYAVLGIGLSQTVLLAGLTPPPLPTISNNYGYVYSENGRLEKQAYDDGGSGEFPRPPDNRPRDVRLDENRDTIHVKEISDNGGGFGGNLTVDNRITKIGVIDFSDGWRYHTSTLVRLDIADDNLLVFRNWVGDSRIKVYAKGVDLIHTTRRIAFEIDGKLIAAKWAHKTGGGFGNAGRHMDWIIPIWGQEWIPLPESSTYGAIFAIVAGAFGLRRKKRLRKRGDLSESLQFQSSEPEGVGEDGNTGEAHGHAGEHRAEKPAGEREK